MYIRKLHYYSQLRVFVWVVLVRMMMTILMRMVLVVMKITRHSKCTCIDIMNKYIITLGVYNIKMPTKSGILLVGKFSSVQAHIKHTTPKLETQLNLKSHTNINGKSRRQSPYNWSCRLFPSINLCHGVTDASQSSHRAIPLRKAVSSLQNLWCNAMAFGHLPK